MHDIDILSGFPKRIRSAHGENVVHLAYPLLFASDDMVFTMNIRFPAQHLRTRDNTRSKTGTPSFVCVGGLGSERWTRGSPVPVPVEAPTWPRSP